MSKELKKLKERGLVRLEDGLYRLSSLQALMDYSDGHGAENETLDPNESY